VHPQVMKTSINEHAALSQMKLFKSTRLVDVCR